MSLKLIDLTHTLTEKTPSWEGRCGFRVATEHDYLDDPDAISFRVQTVSMNCGIGTHLDAPAHCIKNALTIDQIPLDHLINIPGYCIDISSRCDQDNCLTAYDILEFEATHGIIQDNSCVLINTGWPRYWNDAERYHNDYQFPYVQIDSAELLADRNVRVLGIDTLSPDRPNSGYPVHGLLLSKNGLIVENVSYLNRLPPKDFTVSIAPLNMQAATESPIRMWAAT
jgi:kynurenine formamidase